MSIKSFANCVWRTALELPTEKVVANMLATEESVSVWRSLTYLNHSALTPRPEVCIDPAACGVY